MKNFTYRYNALLKEESVSSFFKENPFLFSIIKTLDFPLRYVLTTVVSLNQGPIVFHGYQKQKDLASLLKAMGETLLQVENFYSSIGGIIGYHKTIVSLLKKKPKKNFTIYSPVFFDIRKHSVEVKQKILLGLKNLNKLAEIYPVGGAGDRLGLVDEKKKEPLPTASLPFLGISLLEMLIRDLQAREHLYYETFNKKLHIPIVMMTSHDKNNHEHILEILEEEKYFNRPKELFFFIKQISVPVISVDGDWVMKEPLVFTLKPGGHGVLWKLMEEQGAFDWLYSLKKTKAIVRQINNPIASTDYGILAMIGYGIHYKKSFGFAACPRRIHAAEGTNVLFETKNNKGYNYTISNIEYSDFERYKIQDAPVLKGSIYSKFPANTNVLFIDLKSVQRAVKTRPLPGMIINMKGKAIVTYGDGQKKEKQVGRLELMMQNISEEMSSHFPSKKTHLQPQTLKTFLTYNDRKKTISTTKRFYTTGGPILETPEGCHLDILHNYHHLLSEHCKMKMPRLPTEKEYLKVGPSFVCYLHPLLGPFYSSIAKKIRGGYLYFHSELFLSLANLKMTNVIISGSLVIIEKDFNSETAASCILENVKIENSGIDWDKKNIFWKMDFTRKECAKIILHKNSYFTARDIIIPGDICLEVPENRHLELFSENGGIVSKLS